MDQNVGSLDILDAIYVQGVVILICQLSYPGRQEEFLRDVMQFLTLRGHTRLIPQGGLAEFPDAILNAKRALTFSTCIEK